MKTKAAGRIFGCLVCTIMAAVTGLIVSFMLAVLAGGWLSRMEQDTGLELIGHSGPSELLLLGLTLFFAAVFFLLFIVKHNAFHRDKASCHVAENTDEKEETDTAKEADASKDSAAKEDDEDKDGKDKPAEKSN